MAKIQNAEVIDLSKYNGRFVRVRGKIKKIQQLRKGEQLIFLKHKRMNRDCRLSALKISETGWDCKKSVKVIFCKLRVLQLSTKKAVAN